MNNFDEELLMLRGLKKEWINKYGLLKKSAFIFEPNEKRKDDFQEASINWVDDSNAYTQILNQMNKRKPEEFQFTYGYAIAKLSELNRTLAPFKNKGIFGYERDKLVDNPYHGNLLLKKDVYDEVRGGILATFVHKIIPRENSVRIERENEINQRS